MRDALVRNVRVLCTFYNTLPRHHTQKRENVCRPGSFNSSYLASRTLQSKHLPERSSLHPPPSASARQRMATRGLATSRPDQEGGGAARRAVARVRCICAGARVDWQSC